MRTETSYEARELAAVQVMQLDAAAQRVWIHDLAPPEQTPPWPDGAMLLTSANAVAAVDPWRAALFAEAALAVHRRRPVRALRDAMRANPAVLRAEGQRVSLELVESLSIADGNRARREALADAVETEVPTMRAPSRAVIDATRSLCDALDPSLRAALALGDDAHDDLFDGTEDLFRELDAWVCRRHELDPDRLTWFDRLRTLVGTSARAAIPSATWSSLGARMGERAGLDGALRGIDDDLAPAATAARGVWVFTLDPGVRTRVSGRPSQSLWGLGDVLGAMHVATVQCGARGPFAGVRRGCDRGVDGVAHAMGRRMLLERHFLQREAGLDASAREAVMLEAVHHELLRVRFDVARARIASHVLARRPEAAVRVHDELRRAWRASPPTSHGPWIAARVFDDGGFWGRAAGASAAGARAEARVVATLRAQHDEDWFRNPRAGATVSAVADAMRASGVRAWCEQNGGACDAKETVTRLEHAAREARRGL